MGKKIPTLVHNPLGEQLDDLGARPVLGDWVELQHRHAHHIAGAGGSSLGLGLGALA